MRVSTAHEEGGVIDLLWEGLRVKEPESCNSERNEVHVHATLRVAQAAPRAVSS